MALRRSGAGASVRTSAVYLVAANTCLNLSRRVSETMGTAGSALVPGQVELGQDGGVADAEAPLRHHVLGVNAWTAREVGDRIINEHDESDPDSDEELYLVVRGRAMFELRGDRVAAPTGTFISGPR